VTDLEDADKGDNLIGKVFGPSDSDSNEERNIQENEQKKRQKKG
jgi:hypothetical protein